MWLRAIVGRARENKAVAEVELTTSTSKDVCELWNGSTVVRIMGTSQVLELILFDEPEDPRDHDLVTLKHGKFEVTKSRPSHQMRIREGFLIDD